MVVEEKRGRSSNYDAIVADGSVVSRQKWDSKGDRAESSPVGRYETFGARVLGASRPLIAPRVAAKRTLIKFYCGRIKLTGSPAVPGYGPDK